MAEARPELNVLGLEIRKPLAEKNREEAAGVANLGFISCNANVDLSRILHGVNEHSAVERVCIQFPDPHFKMKHRKRRVVQPELVDVARRDQARRLGSLV